MNCVWFERRLDELLDERLPPDGDAELNEHAEGCPRCAALLADHLSLLEALEQFVGPRAPSDLAARILAEASNELVSIAPDRSLELASSRVGVARRSVRRSAIGSGAIWSAVAIAAVLLISVGVMHWGGTHHAAAVVDSHSRNLNSPRLAIDAAIGDRIHNPAIGGNHADGSGPLATRSVVEMESLAGWIGVPQRALMEQMTDGLKPVTHSMSAALSALRRTLPGSEARGYRGA